LVLGPLLYKRKSFRFLKCRGRNYEDGFTKLTSHALQRFFEESKLVLKQCKSNSIVGKKLTARNVYPKKFASSSAYILKHVSFVVDGGSAGNCLLEL